MREIEEAIAKVESGEVSEGLDRLGQALQKANDEDKYEIAQLYYEWGHVEQARTIIEELKERYPEESELVFFLVEILIDHDEEERAIALLEEIESDAVDQLRALLLLADIYASQGFEEVAEQKLLEAKRMAPDEPVITFALAEFYAMTGDYKKSVPLYEQVIEEGDTLEENVNLKLAEALSASGEFEEALPYFQKASEDSIDLNGWYQYGLTAFQAGEFQQTIHALSVLKERDPHFDALYYYLMKAYRNEGLMDEARQTAEEGLRLNSFSDQLAYEAGDLALAEGRTQDAETYFKKTLEIQSLHHDALKSLASLLLSQERHEEVIDLLGSIEDSEEQDPVFAWNLATAYGAEERYAEALKFYEQAHKALQENPAFLEEYGNFLVEEGRRKEAVRVYRAALLVDPTLLHLEERIGELEEE